MLKNIQSEIARLCRIIYVVTGAHIEIVAADMIRVAGTGAYADTEGQSLGQVGNIYRHVLNSGQAVCIETPGTDPICIGCARKDDCSELLLLCLPIPLRGETVGIIGVACFTEEERKRVQAQKQVFAEFVEQIAAVISNRMDEEQRTRKTHRMLDALLQVTDGNTRGILILDKAGAISYINEVAGREFSLKRDCIGTQVQVLDIGNVFTDMQEYEVSIEGVKYVAFGRFTALESPDEDFDAVLLTEPLPRFTKMFSRIVGSVESPGGLDAIIGDSRKLENLKKRVRQIAKTSSTVLITGESGTGKEMFARAIHAESNRRDEPFVAINCGAIPDELLESELFGYVRGAFTGANTAGRMGKFELANKGVIFLDEISSMSLYLQVKLLRVLQERSFTRLGSNRDIKVDVRVIAATNNPLQELVEQRMFRDDLYYRLNVVPLDLPSLRQRKEDIPQLAEYFLARYCRRFEKPPARMVPRILEMFQAYDWPGNIREFENCIEYMINMHEGGVLRPSLVPLKIRAAHSRSLSGTGGTFAEEEDPSTVIVNVKDTPIPRLADLEAAAIRDAVRRFGNTISGKKRVAEALGIGIATVYRKLRQLPDL